MTRVRPTKAIDRSQAIKYHGVARSLIAAAEALSELADDDESYGNAIALLAVHACVAYGDAVCIAYGEQKSQAGDHGLIVPLLREIMRERLPATAERAIKQVVTRKDEIAYQGRFFPLHDARAILAQAHTFTTWAETQYQQRPPA